MAHDRPDVGVDHRGAGALVLPDLRQDVRGQAEVGVSIQLLAQHLRRAPLVRRIGIGVQQADRDRFDALLPQPLGDLARLGFVERLLHLTTRAEPLGEFVAQAPWHQRRRLLVLQVVHHGDAQPPHLEHVAKAFGGDQRRLRALVLEDGVRRDRGGMHHRLDVSRRDAVRLAQLSDRRQDGAAVVVRRGRNLQRTHRATAAHDDVGEGAADVAAEDVARHGASISSAARQAE